MEAKYTICINCLEWVPSCQVTASFVRSDGTVTTIYTCDECVKKEKERATRGIEMDRPVYCEYHCRVEMLRRDEYVVIKGYGCVCKEGVVDSFKKCEICGEYVFTTDMVYTDETKEKACCLECSDKNRKTITDYHNYGKKYFETNKKYMDYETIDETTVFCGFELEVESVVFENKPHTITRDNLATKLSNLSDCFVYENDGSLEYGFEIISVPFTKDFMNEKLKETIYYMLENLNHYNFTPYDNCGLHFHLSRINNPSKPITLEFACLIEYYRDEFILLSKRDDYSLERWANFMMWDYSKEDLIKGYVYDKYADCCDTKYKAINFNHRNTIEVRFFSSTTDFNELMARYEMIYNVYKYAIENELNEDLSNMPNFYELITYETDNYVTKYLENNFENILEKYANTFRY